jgi:hypothetical protein
MKPLEFYRLAVAMAPSAVSEPVQRTVVGRLYYGLHHEACCRFYRENQTAVPLERRNRHASLLRFFNRPTDAKSAKVANLLEQLRQFRTLADYDLNQMYFNKRPVTAAQVLSSATHVAAQLLAALESYSPGEAADGCVCRVN